MRGGRRRRRGRLASPPSPGRDEHFHGRQIVAGQYLGFTVLVAVSVAVSAGLLALPVAVTGLLGVI
ncbi:MAG TPA: hypothetical protein VMU39_15755, partial [Solirubrobacteraceae bacterium]|nr:hypothetical protein [Solirubrobacteraceae bacterium]